MGQRRDKAKKKARGFLHEFKKFALRGNVIDLAVGVIIGGAFQRIVTSLVNDLLMPCISMLVGGLNFTNQFIILRVPASVSAEDLADAGHSLSAMQALGVTTLNFGNFVSVVIDFIIMAFVIFLLVKTINSLSELGKKQETPTLTTKKICPYCFSEIPLPATRCAHCTSSLQADEP